MTAPPPSQDELFQLADRLLGLVGGDGQVTARWTPAGTTVEVAVLDDGRVGRAAGPAADAGDLVGRARADAREVPGARLGEPAPGRMHDGYDPAVLRLDARRGLRAVAEKVAIVSTAGVRAFEQRSAVEIGERRESPGRWLALAEAAVGPAGLDAPRLAADTDLLFGAGTPIAPPDEELPLVLSPWAVAAVLRLAAPAFSAAAADERRRVAPAINLSDSPRFPATLPRSYDAEGVPRRPVPLIQDGVPHRLVHDSTTAAAAGTTSTGHATAPGGLAPPVPAHLVLVGGGAADLEELAAPLERGLLIGAIAGGSAHGVRLIRGGELAEPVADHPVSVDPFAVLASTQALTGRGRTIAWWGGDSWGATVAPGLRAGHGVAFSPAAGRLLLAL